MKRNNILFLSLSAITASFILSIYLSYFSIVTTKSGWENLAFYRNFTFALYTVALISTIIGITLLTASVFFNQVRATTYIRVVYFIITLIFISIIYFDPFAIIVTIWD